MLGFEKTIGGLLVKRVLLVEDSKVTRNVIAQRLRDAGFRVDEASHGIEAAEQALASPPDVVVTDLWMPGFSGVQLCRLLRAEPVTAHLPVLVLSGTDDRKTRFWVRTAGANGFVAKSEIAELAGRIHQALADPRPLPPTSVRTPLFGSVLDRMSQLLDEALFSSVISADIAAMLTADGNAATLFESLTNLASEVVAYEWFALYFDSTSELFFHCRSNAMAEREARARQAMSISSVATCFSQNDDRPLDVRGGKPIVRAVTLHGKELGRVAFAPEAQGASKDELRFLKIASRELAGPIQSIELFQALRRIAATDPLTGLMNRRAFLEAMSRERERAIRQHVAVPLSVLLLDLDHFKGINDALGHGAGDTVLRGMAQLLLAFARKSDFVARWGGEEFVMALAGADLDGAVLAAERLRGCIEATKHAVGKTDDLVVTASIGVAMMSEKMTIDHAIALADEALYKAKNSGRNRVEVSKIEGP